MAKYKKKPIYIFLLLLVLLYVVIYIIPKVTGALETTIILEPGNLQVTEDADCYIVRDEKVYEASSAGTLDYLIDEGIHIRKGTKVLKLEKHAPKEDASSDYQEITDRLKNSSVVNDSYTAKSSGILSYYADGYEGYFTPNTIGHLNEEELKKQKFQAEELKRKSTLAKEPLFKICDNDNWYIVCWVEAGSISRYEVGKNATIELSSGNVDVKIKNITEDGEKWKITFWTNRYYEDFTKIRAEKATIVSEDYNGLLIPNKSITTRNGQAGVMVKSKIGDFVFKPVKVVASDGQQSVVNDLYFTNDQGERVDTVNIYDEILKKPGKGN